MAIYRLFRPDLGQALKNNRENRRKVEVPPVGLALSRPTLRALSSVSGRLGANPTGVSKSARFPEPWMASGVWMYAATVAAAIYHRICWFLASEFLVNLRMSLYPNRRL